MTRETGKSIGQENAEPHQKSKANEGDPIPRKQMGTRPAHFLLGNKDKKETHLKAMWLDII